MNDKMRSFVRGLLVGMTGQGVLGEADHYLYNGLKFPQLPEWDKETYPYAAIILYASGTTVATYILSVGSSVRYAYPDVWTSNELGWRYDEDADAWVECLGIFSGDLLWANHDVCYPDDTAIYLAASNPAQIGQAQSEKLVGYSYNGIVLPALPDYDKDAYPYALIIENDGEYRLRLYSSEATWAKDTTLGVLIYFGKGVANITAIAYPENSCGVVPAEWGEKTNSTGGTLRSATVIWANFTGEYNGTVYWDASEDPTPVYGH